MSQNVSCPNCRRPLQVRDDLRMTWFSCPRCLALVENPALRTAVQLEPQGGRQARRSLADEPVVLLPADSDVRFDLGILGGGLVLVALLTAVGSAVYLLGGGLKQADGWNFDAVLLVWLILMVLPLIGVGLALTSKSSSRRLVIGALGGATTILVAVGLPVILVLAVVIAIATTCCGPPARYQPPPTTAGRPAGLLSPAAK